MHKGNEYVHTCTKAIPAIQFAANLALWGNPTPLANIHVPKMNTSVEEPCGKIFIVVKSLQFGPKKKKYIYIYIPALEFEHRMS